jgi:hypothetical protein
MEVPASGRTSLRSAVVATTRSKGEGTVDVVVDDVVVVTIVLDVLELVDVLDVLELVDVVDVLELVDVIDVLELVEVVDVLELVDVVEVLVEVDPVAEDQVTESFGRLAAGVPSLLSNRIRLLCVLSESWLIRSRSQPPRLASASWQSVERSGKVNGPVPAGGV